jgi:hypothetical protein
MTDPDRERVISSGWFSATDGANHPAAYRLGESLFAALRVACEGAANVRSTLLYGRPALTEPKSREASLRRRRDRPALMGMRIAGCRLGERDGGKKGKVSGRKFILKHAEGDIDASCYEQEIPLFQAALLDR